MQLRIITQKFLKPSGLYVLMKEYECPIKTTPTCTWTALFILYSQQTQSIMSTCSIK